MIDILSGFALGAIVGWFVGMSFMARRVRSAFKKAGMSEEDIKKLLSS